MTAVPFTSFWLFVMSLSGGAPPADPRLTVTVAESSGFGTFYQAFPLRAPGAASAGIEGSLVANLDRFRVTADYLKRQRGRGWALDIGGEIRVIHHGSFTLSARAQSYVASSGDILYRGPSDVALGIRRTADSFLTGGSARLGSADYPTAELTVLTGSDRAQQTPELWLDNALVRQQDPLTQIANRFTFRVQLRAARLVTQRVVVSGTVTYAAWRRASSPLMPDQAVALHAVARYAVWRGVSVSAAGRWQSDERGPTLYRSSVTLGVTLRQW